MRLSKLYSCLLVIGLFGLSGGYKVLVLFPFPGKSHSILGEGFVNILIRDGHEVTYVTPISIKKPPKNLTQVDISSLLQTVPPATTFSIDTILDNTLDLTDYNIVFSLMQSTAKEVVLHENIQTLLKDRSKQFDVVIAEWMFNELYAGFANVFSCPLIWSSSIDPHWLILELLGQHVSPAVVPDPHATSLPPYSLWERLIALLNMMQTKFLKYRKYTPIDAQLYQQAFSAAAAARGVQLLPFEEMRLNASLVLGNSHVAAGQAMALPPSYVPIGGYHLFGEEEKMSADLQKILDSSTQGVIYFSMGSVLKSKDMSEDMKKDLIKVFGKLKQTVLWKMEENISSLPNNVHTIQWAPQRSILNHPNTVLFISHGGLLSTTEALYYGVPIIGIPAFADQFQNIARAVQKGFAVKVTLTRELAADLQVAIRKVLDNNSYKERVQLLSWVFKSGGSSADTLTRAVTLAVKERTLLQPPALPLYQVLFLDVAALGLAGLMILVWAVRKAVGSLNYGGKKQKAL